MGWKGWKPCVHRQEIIKMDQFRSKITKIRVSLFRMSEICRIPARGQCQAARYCSKFSNRIKDAGIAIRHSQGYLFYTAGSGSGLEGAEAVCPTQLTLRKRHCFVAEKYVEFVKQDEKHVPDLLELIMRPPGLVKEELRPFLFKSINLDSKIIEILVSPVWIPDIRLFPAGGQCQLAR